MQRPFAVFRPYVSIMARSHSARSAKWLPACKSRNTHQPNKEKHFKMDLQLFNWINQLAGRNLLLDQGMTLLSDHGAVVFVLILAGVWFTHGAHRNDGRQAVLLTLLAVFLALSFNQLVDLFYFRPRPFVFNEANLLIEKSADSNSFPSNHSAGAFAITFVLLWLRRTLGVPLLGLAILLAFSRIYVGVHYPLDILAGILSALLATTLVYWQRARIQAIIGYFPLLAPSGQPLKNHKSR